MSLTYTINHSLTHYKGFILYTDPFSPKSTSVSMIVVNNNTLEWKMLNMLKSEDKELNVSYKYTGALLHTKKVLIMQSLIFYIWCCLLLCVCLLGLVGFFFSQSVVSISNISKRSSITYQYVSLFWSLASTVSILNS